jgi:putative methyltransferase (TIGR04325 family)
VLQRLRAFGPVRALRRERYRRWFASPAGYAANWGVFATFAEAMASAPARGGFDQPRMADEYADRFDRIFAYDDPVLFWLERAMQAGARRVLDVGGHVGVHFYAYRRRLCFPEGFSWCVAEVDAVARAGRARAEAAGERALSFTTSFEDLDALRPDVVLSCGALQYVEEPLLWDVLSRAKQKPAHVLLNKLTVYDGDDFVSLQNIGVGFAPHWVWNRRRLVERFERAGYALEDTWSVPERRFFLFDDPARSFGPYAGLCFARW